MPNISESAVDLTHLAEEGHSVNNDVIDLTEEGRGLEVNLNSLNLKTCSISLT